MLKKKGGLCAFSFNQMNALYANPYALYRQYQELSNTIDKLEQEVYTLVGLTGKLADTDSPVGYTLRSAEVDTTEEQINQIVEQIKLSISANSDKITTSVLTEMQNSINQIIQSLQ